MGSPVAMNVDRAVQVLREAAGRDANADELTADEVEGLASDHFRTGMDGFIIGLTSDNTGKTAEDGRLLAEATRDHLQMRDFLREYSARAFVNGRTRMPLDDAFQHLNGMRPPVMFNPNRTATREVSPPGSTEPPRRE